MAGLCVGGFVDPYGGISGKQRSAPRQHHGVVIDDQHLGQGFRVVLHQNTSFCRRISSLPMRQKREMKLRIRIPPIWTRLPLRARLSLLLATMFVAALLLGIVSLQIFATEQLAEESGPAARSAKVVAEALNAALRTSQDPRQTLDAFAQTLGSSETIRFRPAGPVPFTEPAQAPELHGRAPHCFADLLTIPQIGTSFPVLVVGKRVGDIVFSPDVSWEIYEKWIGFLAIIVAATLLTLTTGIIAHFTVGTALQPLEDLAAGLTRMRNGD